MIGLPSLHAMDRAQGARIWMASEATDMRCGFIQNHRQLAGAQFHRTRPMLHARHFEDSRFQALGWDRCFETEACAALPASDRKLRIKSPLKTKNRKRKNYKKDRDVCNYCKLVETRLNERARQRNFCEQLSGRQRVVESDAT
jgi:hypothetical protein